MTVLKYQIRLPDPAARNARVVRVNFRPKEEGAGNAGRALHPRSRVQSAQRKTHTSIQVQRRQPRHSPRNGFAAYGALSPATNSSCHRHRQISDFTRPGWACKNLHRLDTSNGCQDHTLLPYAATRLHQKRLCRALAPFVLREGYRSRDKPALRFRPYADAAASTASRPNVRDDGQRPSLKDETARLIVLICPTG
jgi:hypothetical protein